MPDWRRCGANIASAGWWCWAFPATSKYDVSFPLFSKIEVNGDQAHPLYRLLKSAAPGVLGSERIKWNFTKFLVDAQGKVVARFAPLVKPEKLAEAIEPLLSAR